MEKLRSAMDPIPNEEVNTTALPTQDALQHLVSLSEPLPEWETPTRLEDMDKADLIRMINDQAKVVQNLRSWIGETQQILRTLINSEQSLAPPPPELPVEEKEEKEEKPVATKKKTKRRRKKKPPAEPNLELLKKQGLIEQKKRLAIEKKEWDDILRSDEKKYRSRVLTLRGIWKQDQYLLKPVRHYADCYSRKLLLRNLRSAKMLSSIINPYFYPSYRSTFATRAYVNYDNPERVWLRDDEDQWHDLPFSHGVKNMIYHSVTAFVDLIRRERPILAEEDWCKWRQEQATLERCQSENYQFVYKNLEKRIPRLRGHPELEEQRIAEIFLRTDERKLNTLAAIEKEYPHYCMLEPQEQEKILWQRVIHDLRHQEQLKKAIQYHQAVPDLSNLPPMEDPVSQQEQALENAIQISEERHTDIRY
jgi:hypothetical protein